jgi:hypothetical protein
MENPDELFTAEDIAWLKAKGITLNAPPGIPHAETSVADSGVSPRAARIAAPENTEHGSGAGPSALALGLLLLLLVSRAVVAA